MKLGDYLNAINYTKDNLFEDVAAHGGYVPFVINRSLSYFPDTVLQANEMNTHHHLGKREQFDYLLNTIVGLIPPFVSWSYHGKYRQDRGISCRSYIE
jgi:hypothetical protein